jgi:NAD(P)-dependent dehydrogenase (short-subunit alcohol dehydrogenase family)
MSHNSTALITGASRGLGLALARDLARDGWHLIIDGRNAAALQAAADELASLGDGTVRAVPGDVTDETHQAELVVAAIERGGLDAVVLSASTLGLSPMPPVLDHPVEVLRRIYEVNVFAPLGLTHRLLPHLREGAAVVAVTSDAAVQAYEGWGGYGSSKAALEHAFAVVAVEHPELRVYRVDPGEMRTQMYQESAPGEDISDLPPPEISVPGFRALLAGSFPSGRYEARSVPTLSPSTSSSNGAAS